MTNNEQAPGSSSPSPLESFMPGVDEAADDYWLTQMGEYARTIQEQNDGEISGPTEYILVN